MELKEMINKLHHGDCLELMSTMPKNSVDVTLTDIPYGEVSRESGGLRNLDKGKADIIGFNLEEFTKESIRVTKGTVMIFCGTQQVSDIIRLMREAKMSTRILVWQKTNPTPLNGKKLFLSGIEIAAYGRKPKATFNGSCVNTVFKYPVGRNKLHVTEKPMALFKELISLTSNKGDVIFDSCAGAGTTCAAAALLGRKFIGVEIDPASYAVMQSRMSDIHY